MLEEMQMGGGGERPEPRVQFEILPAAAAQPVPTAGWTRGAAALLLLLTLGSTLQFGLAANIGLLPKVSHGMGLRSGLALVTSWHAPPAELLCARW